MKRNLYNYNLAGLKEKNWRICLKNDWRMTGTMPGERMESGLRMGAEWMENERKMDEH